MVHSRSRHGFTLIELLVSCVIVGVGLAALSQLYVTAMWSYQKARMTSLATQRARYELEKAENLKFSVMNDCAHLISDTRYPASEGYRELPGNNGVEFDMSNLRGGHGTIKVSHFHGYANLLQIDITITWQGTHATQSPVHVVMLLAG